MNMLLRESMSYDNAKIVVESAQEGKDLYMKGICIQGGVRNANERIYPVEEIAKAVSSISKQIKKGILILVNLTIQAT